MKYLSVEDIQEIHESHININPQEGGVHNYGILYMAPTLAARYTNIYYVAACYMVDIARFQPYNDGNR